MKRILVTGAAGFVGRRLTRALRDQGYTVLESDQYLPEAVAEGRCCDIADRDSVNELLQWAAPLDGVLHLAAITFIPEAQANPSAVMRINLEGTVHLIDAMKRHTPAARLVFISTSEVYGPPITLPVDESHPLNPQNPYAISKAAADHYCAYASARGDLDIVRMRPFNHSGAGQSDTFVLSNFAKQLAAMEQTDPPLQMHVGNLDVARDFTHVDDVVRAYEQVLNQGESGAVYNICSGQSVTIRSAVESLMRHASLEVELVVDPERVRPTEVKDVRGDHSSFTRLTGWVPDRSIDSLLSELLDYWRAERAIRD